MPSPRRLRLVLLATLIAVVVILFYTSGFDSRDEAGRLKDFYQRTKEAMERGTHGQPVINSKTGKKAGLIPADKDGDGDIDEDDKAASEDLQQRLKAAAQEAKDKANEKSPLKPDAPSDVIGVGSSAGGNKKPKKKGSGKTRIGASKDADDADELGKDKDEDDDDEEPAAKSKPKTKPKLIKGETDDEDDDTPAVKSKPKPKPKILKDQDDDEEDEDEAPAKSKSNAKTKPKPKTDVKEDEEDEDEDDEDDEESDIVDKEENIEKVLDSILKRSPVIIFSKTYCPYSMRVKGLLLEKYSITPEPYVVELDEHPRGADLQSLLGKKTGRSTVPNVLIEGTSIGGSDEVVALDTQDKLMLKFRDMSGKHVEIEERFTAQAETDE